MFILTRSNREIIKETVPSIHESHGMNNGSTQNSQDNYGVCLFIHTRVLVDNQKPDSDLWYEKFFSYTNKVLIPSILRQCELHSCPSMRSLYLLIRIQGHHNKLDKFIQDVGQKINVRVFHKLENYNAIVQRIVDQDDCKWLAAVHIDADDAFLDGYFNYVSSELTGKLVQTLTMDGSPWRGAVFAHRDLPLLVIGNGRCVHFKARAFCSGQTQGQGFLLRRDAWEKMGRILPQRGLHTTFISHFRNFIMKRLGFEKYHSDACKWPNAPWKNSDYENKDAAESRIMYIDLSLEPWCVWIVTPFSSHFPWNKRQDLPVCGVEEKEVIQGYYPKNIKYILDIVDSVDFNITLEEACRNNRYLLLQSHDCSQIAVSGDDV